MLGIFFLLLMHACNAVGQLLMKTAVSAREGWARLAPMALAIGFMTLQFFLNLGVLQRFDLSYAYPFQAATVIFIVIGARFFLGEKLSRRNLLALAVICAGVVLVSGS